MGPILCLFLADQTENIHFNKKLQLEPEGWCIL